MKVGSVCSVFRDAQTTNNALAISDVKFLDAVRHELSSNRYYYTQDLKYRGSDLYLTSDWFRSDGLKQSMDRKPEMLVKTDGDLRLMLQCLDAEAKRQLRIPAEFASTMYFNNETAYRSMSESGFLFIKLEYSTGFFNKLCQSLKAEELGYGDYRVIIHVKGIYIGPHGQGSKLASLQLRIHQIQYCPVVIQCLFSSSIVSPSIVPQALGSGGNVTVPPTPQPGQVAAPFSTATAGGGAKKSGRRPTKLQLQRQNTTTDLDKVAGINAGDFFSNLDLEMTQ